MIKNIFLLIKCQHVEVTHRYGYKKRRVIIQTTVNRAKKISDNLDCLAYLANFAA